jgi:hypothetical protein
LSQRLEKSGPFGVKDPLVEMLCSVGWSEEMCFLFLNGDEVTFVKVKAKIGNLHDAHLLLYWFISAKKRDHLIIIDI